MTVVGVDGVNLTGAGTVSAPTAADRKQLARAHAHGLPGVLLVANWSNAVNDFSEPLAHKTLGEHREDRRSGVGARGRRRDRQAGTASRSTSRRSRRATRPGSRGSSPTCAPTCPAATRSRSALSATTSHSAYAAMGYDLPALAASVDQIVLMTYDDHGPWEKTPGPIGPLGWQRASVAALEKDVPAAQIFLGVANYAYAWRPHSRSRAHRRAGARARQAPARQAALDRERRRVDGEAPTAQRSGGRTSGR